MATVSEPSVSKEQPEARVVEQAGLSDALPPVVYIARCPEHGLHGARDTCFVCGKPVEQVPMVEAARVPKQEITEEQIAAATSALERLDPQWRATAYGPRRYAIEALQAAFYGEDGE